MKNGFQSDKEILDEMLRTGDFGESEDRAYRRGWQQGWGYAASVILAMIKQGMPVQEIHEAITLFEDRVIAPWRASQDWSGAPVFCDLRGEKCNDCEDDSLSTEEDNHRC